MGGQWRKENPNPRVHRSGGKLGEPRFPLERVDPRVGIFLSPLTTHDGFYLSTYSTSSVTVQAGLCRTWSKTQKTSFLASRLKTLVIPFHHIGVASVQNFGARGPWFDTYC